MKNYELKIQNIQLNNINKRILIISDIHGGYDFFVKLLEKVNYTSDDILFILGDILEKGPDSLKTLRYVMELYEKGNVYMVLGNNDHVCLHVLNDEKIDKYPKYLKKIRSIYHDFGEELNVDLSNDNIDNINLRDFNKLIRENYSKELNFIKNLPTIIESEDYLFAHASITDYNNMNKLDPYEVMRYDYFMRCDFVLPKMLFVGHYPTVAFTYDKCYLGPVTDFKKNITSIDGGYTSKIGGQINLLLINSKLNNNGILNNKLSELNYEFYSIDDLEQVEVVKDAKGKKASVIAIWDRERFKIVIKGKKSSLCLVENKLCIIPNYFIYYEDNATIYGRKKDTKYFCTDYTNEKLSLIKGEKVGIIKYLGKKVLIKKDNVIGFTNIKNIKHKHKI